MKMDESSKVREVSEMKIVKKDKEGKGEVIHCWGLRDYDDKRLLLHMFATRKSARYVAETFGDEVVKLEIKVIGKG